MKHRLTSGAEIELVSPAELREILGETFPARHGPQTERPFQGVTVDSSGNGSVTLFEVPTGAEFELHSIYIDADGKSPASRMSTGYALLLRNSSAVDEYDFTLTGKGIPVRYSYTSDAPLYHERETVAVQFFGITASTTVVVRGQGTRQPLVGVM